MQAVALGRQPKFQAAMAAMQPVHTLKEPAVAETSIKPVPESAYASRQMQLFGTFFASGRPEEQLSNAVSSLDLLPRFSVSRARMAMMRTADGHLPPIDREVTIEGVTYRVRVWPAQIEVDGKWMSFYPAAREEIVEQALRKIASLQRQGFYESESTGHRTGVRFSITQLRDELTKQGHPLNYVELTQALDILSLSSLEISPMEGDKKKPEFYRANFLVALGRRSWQQYLECRKTREGTAWIAEFHPMLAKAIANIGYRQTNYRLWMTLTKQIERYLYMRLALRFTNASILTTYDIKYSTIKTDSGLFEGRKRETDCMAEVDQAWKRLSAIGIISKIETEYLRGPRNCIQDIKFKVIPTNQFVAEQKAANKRKSEFMNASALAN